MVKQIVGCWLFDSKNVNVSSTYLFQILGLHLLSPVPHILILFIFHVDASYNSGNRACHSCSVLLFINRPVVLEICWSQDQIHAGVKFLRLARSLSFSSFRNAAWTAPSIDTFVNNDSTSRCDLVADFFLIDVTSASKTHQTNPLEAKRCEFAQDTPITPKFYEHHVLFYSSCSSFKGHVH